MASDRDERIRQRAFEIWQREGQPHGRHEEHWRMAAQEIDAEMGGASTGRGRRSANGAAEKKVTGRQAAAPGAGRAGRSQTAPAEAAASKTGSSEAARNGRTRSGTTAKSSAAASKTAAERGTTGKRGSRSRSTAQE